MKTRVFSLICTLMLPAMLMVAQDGAAASWKSTQERPARQQASQGDNARVLSLLANTSEQLRPKVVKIIETQQKKLGGCQTLSRLDAEEIWVMDRVDFYDNGNPARGRWQVRYTATLCGQKVVRNVIFSASGGGEMLVGQRMRGDAGVEVGGVSVDVAAPGESLTDPQLRVDTWRSFSLAAMKTVPACQTPVLKETQVVERPKGPNATWRELWIGRVCDREVAQMITFYPSPAGTLFRMTLPEQPVNGLVKRNVPNMRDSK